MSDNNNMALLAVLAVGYLYMRRQQQAVVASNVSRAPVGTAVGSMPGSVGTGWQQVAAGAVGGFLQSLAKGPANNSSTTVIPNYAPGSYGAVQDTVYEPQSVDDIVGMNTDTTWWA